MEDKAADGRFRVTLDFSPEAFEKLQELKRQTGGGSNRETIRKALALLDWYISRRRERYELRLVKGDIVKDVELFI